MSRRPPLKVGERANGVRLVLKHDTPLGLRGFQIIEGKERVVGDPLVGPWPQALTGLQFGRIRRQEEQMNAFWDHELWAAMPTSSIKDQEHPLGGTGTDGLGEMRQSDTEHFCCDSREQEPLRLARRWMHETVDVEPLEAMLHSHTRA